MYSARGLCIQRLTYVGRWNTGACRKKLRGFIRGGNWNNGANDGAFALNLNNAPGNTNTNIGFRCARYAFAKSRPESARRFRADGSGSPRGRRHRRKSIRACSSLLAEKNIGPLPSRRYRPDGLSARGYWAPNSPMTDMQTPTFEQSFSFENMLAAYARARRGKGARDEVAHFGWRLEANLLALREELLSGTYAHGPYRRFVVADSKRREIQAAPFRDRIVHQCVVAALEPLYERRFMYDSYACRKGKGTHAAIARFERFARVSRYALLMDVSKYFASIDHGILLSLLSRRVRDERMLALCRLIVESSEEAPDRGIPIGNLTSQLFSNIYLNELDQYVKHALRVRRYVRYMDDFILLHDDREYLRALKDEITEFLARRLALTAHPHKVRIERTARGVAFLGLRVFPHHRLLRGSTVRRFIARAKAAKGGRAGGGGGIGGCHTFVEGVGRWRQFARTFALAREAFGRPPLCGIRVTTNYQRIN